MIIKGTIPIRPQPKLRPKFNSITKVTYPNPKTVLFEKRVKLCLLRDVKTLIPKEEPIYVNLKFVFCDPKRTQKNVKHIIKPDLDNLIKSFLDAANKVLFHDDKQICRISAQKLYSNYDAIEYIISSDTDFKEENVVTNNLRL